jgi:hypothetical protein
MEIAVEAREMSEAEQLEKELEVLRAVEARRLERRKVADLRRSIEEARLAAAAEDVADRLVEGGKVRGLDFAIATAAGRVIVVGRTPAPAWEVFQRHAAAPDEPIPPEQYRNAARASLLEVEGAVTKEELSKLFTQAPNLAVTLVNELVLQLNKAGAKRREGK